MQSLDCPPDKIVFDPQRGEYICTETGEVIEERVVDQGAEWRAYTEEEKQKRSRTGAPLNFAIHDLGIDTDISKSPEMSRLIKLNKLVKMGNNKTLVYGLQEIERISNLLNLHKAVKDESAIFFKKIYEKGLIKGRNTDVMVATSIYIACRKMKIARTIEEIAKYTNAEIQAIKKYYRLLYWSLNLNLKRYTTRDYIIKFGENEMLKLSGKTIRDALDLEEKIRDNPVIIGKDPKAVAGALLYISAFLNNERRTQRI